MRISAFHMLLLSSVAVVVIAAALLLLPAADADAGRSVTTEQAATAAGAKVLPTQPPLRIEPK